MKDQTKAIVEVLELTFEQQQEIDKLAYWASKPSSNQNKDKRALIAYVEHLIQSEVNKGKIEELEEISRMVNVVGHHNIKSLIDGRIKQLKEENSDG